jgi:hypothetical protein
VDDAVVLLVGEHGTDRVLREHQVDAGSGLEEDRVVVDLLDGGVEATDGPHAGSGLHLVAHVGGRLLLLLGGAGHQEHGPDEHDEGEEGQDIHGGIPSHDRAE